MHPFRFLSSASPGPSATGYIIIHMVNTAVRRRRLSVEDRRTELMQTCLHLIGTRPWDEVSMAEVALAAGVSKPLLYHYFSTKGDLYVAAVRFAAHELSEATFPDPELPSPNGWTGRSVPISTGLKSTHWPTGRSSRVASARTSTSKRSSKGHAPT